MASEASGLDLREIARRIVEDRPRAGGSARAGTPTLADLVAARRRQDSTADDAPPPLPRTPARRARLGRDLRLTIDGPLPGDAVAVLVTRRARWQVEPRPFADGEIDVALPEEIGEEVVEVWLSRNGRAAGPAVVELTAALLDTHMPGAQA
ncbi:hypothetical protein [Capillimicrobium parvum]|uniref:Uncharacterized protein n=1 Tax=Capillimicrobium parvum TaxID=2884022 RepID=A0A9E6XTH4_9ACTN|nr:hypothetical protein [Capillimicrobium parvum]UGS34280.1 hypothetical protein DSM104329_00656 [Capillimicrobium parvum]